LKRESQMYPRYRDLPIRNGLPPSSSWEVFGPGDEIGTLNFITAEKTREAARLVESGRVFNLDLPLDVPDPPFFARAPYRRTLLELGEGIVRDDVIDGFFPQASSQWDALSHFAHRRYGFYNGVRQDEVTGESGSRLGIEHWAARGIATRGVLVDVARLCEARGERIAPDRHLPISVSLLEETLDSQGVALEQGDVLMLRTGWLAHYLAATPELRRTFAPEEGSPGLSAVEEMAEFLWDHRVAAVVADNVALEVQPTGKESGGSLHRRLIPLLGMAVGELWNLEALAEDCARDRRFASFLVSSPLHLPGGAGSTANALALK
jgi:kynurenine formamidase